MKRQPFEPLSVRTKRVRVLCAWLLVPLLLFVQLLGGRAALLHAHGTAGWHVHVLAAHHEHHAHELSDAWHRAQHATDEHASDEHAPSPAEEPTVELRGVLVQVPASIGIAPDGGHMPGQSTIRPPPVFHGMEPGYVAQLRERPARLTTLPERPQIRSHRSGLATLLRSSRAILI
jgi:hypothetical protein